jgi:response regulator RpfG family c-di-GMP phosphodiesterase
MLSTSESILSKSSAIDTSSGHILLVEDEATIRETTALTLRNEGYSVVTAAICPPSISSFLTLCFPALMA